MQLLYEWVGYLRVSTDEQVDHGVSLEWQREKILAYCGLHGMPIGRMIEDAGWSAKSLERPGIREAIRYLDGGCEGIVVAKLDRITRSVRDWAGLVEDYFARPEAPRFVSASEAIECRSGAGRFVANILMSAAQFERELVVERTGHAMDHKRERGERLGTIPYGSMLSDNGKTLEPNAGELHVIGQMQFWKKQGLNLRETAAKLDELGFETRSGHPWAISTISKLLSDWEAHCESKI